MSMHAGRVANSPRLRRTLELLLRNMKSGVTTLEIQKATGSMAPGTDVSEVRHNGYSIRCKYDGKTDTGRSVYRYYLEDGP